MKIFVLGLLISSHLMQVMAAPHKILLIGDSITYGKPHPPGFRDDLYGMLTDLGYPFTFVGTCNDSPPYRGWYYPGAYIRDFYKSDGAYNIYWEMQGKRPTIAVIHLGTNDFWLAPWMRGGPYTEDGGKTFSGYVAGHLAEFVAYLSRWHDGTYGDHLACVFLCLIIPKSWRHMEEAMIPRLNKSLETMVEDVNAGRLSQIPPGFVRLVDQFSTFDARTMLEEDGTHPNKRGYAHMAHVFLDAFKTLPLSLRPIAGVNQQALPGTRAPEPFVFQVVDGFGHPAADVPVSFRLRGDGEILSNAVVRTDSLGSAPVTVRMGWSDSCTVTAYAAGLIDSIAEIKVYARRHVIMRGRISSGNGTRPVPFVQIRWQEADSLVGESTESGTFLLEGLPRQAPVTLAMSKPRETDTLPALLSYDAALIARFVVGLEPFSAIRRLAADLDRDGEVTVHDAAAVARLVVGLDSLENTSVGEWMFYPPMAFDSLVTDRDSLTVSAIRIGDIREQKTGGTPEASGSFSINTVRLGKASEQGGVQICMPISITGKGVLSCDFRFSVDPSLVRVERIAPPEGSGWQVTSAKEADGRYRISTYSLHGEDDPASVAQIYLSAERAPGEHAMTFSDVVVNQTALSAHHATEVESLVALQPVKTTLGCHPNPFNTSLRMRYALDERADVEMRVVNVLGKTVRTIYRGYAPAGTHDVLWDGRSDRGDTAPSGLYFVLLKTGGRVFVRQIQKFN